MQVAGSMLGESQESILTARQLFGFVENLVRPLFPSQRATLALVSTLLDLGMSLLSCDHVLPPQGWINGEQQNFIECKGLDVGVGTSGWKLDGARE